jgi:hypothetical protein
VALSYLRTSRAGARLRWAGLFGLIAALSLALTPGIADAKKKKKDTARVASYNLYLGSDLADATNAGLARRTDLFADEVGEVLREVNANDFNLRAGTIAKKIKKQKTDLVGLQEAALWRIEVPTDGGGPPRDTSALVPLIDYIDTLLNKLNKKARSKKACGKAAKKRKAQGKKPKPCYRGYRLVGFQQEADVEQLGDFDNNPGPNNRTCDLSSGACGNPYPSGGGGGGSDDWLSGNDDTPNVNVGEPPAPQCADGIDNDGDGRTDFGFDWVTGGTNDEFSTPPPGSGIPAPPSDDCDSRLDNDERPNSAPLSLPQDANMDHHFYSPNFNAPSDPVVGAVPDKFGNGVDQAGVTDCPDTSADAGPSVGADPDGSGGPAPPWDAPGFGAANVPVCLFHGIDGDLRLQMRDAIIARKGAGVKTRNVRGGNFSSVFQVTVFGTNLNFTRGWIDTDASVRGKKFHLVNTHLESENAGTIREDQASELVAPGGPATAPKTVLVGDLNSDPARAPTGLPNNDGGSNIAINRLFAAGFFPVEVPGFSGGHGELLNDLSNTLDNGRIDHILANNPSIALRSGKILDPIGGGLWASDHGGVLSRLKVPGKKKKKK